MKSLSGLGIGLSIVFGCLLLAIFVELYYLLRRKTVIARPEMVDDYSSSARELFYLLFRKKSPHLTSKEANPQSLNAQENDSDIHFLHTFGEDGLDSDIILRQQTPCDRPRFLFTIKEETKEDLESDDGKSKAADDDKGRKGSRSRSLGELLLAVETPYLSPLSSPPFCTPPVTPLDCYHQHGINPLFQPSNADEMNEIMFSPSPRFKFLKDAEEKLHRRLLMERAVKSHNHKSVEAIDDGTSSTVVIIDDKDGSFVTSSMAKKKEKEQHQPLPNSCQVIPLPSPDNRAADKLKK